MEKIIVLGIGNQLMMDDGVGIYLVDELSKLDNSGKPYYIIGETDIEYCLDQIETATFIIVLDAVYSGKNPGEITVYPLAEINEHQTLNISAHNLHLFQVLYQQKDIKGFLIGVEPYEVTFHKGLSNCLQRQWKRILRKVKITIDQLIN